MLDLKRFRNTLVAKGSELDEALKFEAAEKAAGRSTKRKVKGPDGKDVTLPPLSEELYDKTTEAFDKLYGKEARLWFEEMSFPKRT